MATILMLSVVRPSLSSRDVMSLEAVRESLQILYKHPLGLEDELITFLWSKVIEPVT